VQDESGTEQPPADAHALVGRLFRIVLQREPESDERSACAALLQREGLVQLCRVMLNLNEFVYVD
jgi:hypothetical protein